MEDKIFDMGKQKPVAGVVRDSWQHQLWWIFIVLTVMCLYWLSNIVLWVPWSHSPRLGMFFAVCMESKDVWHITTFYGYAWLVILALGEAFFLRKSLLARCYVVTVRVLLVLVGILLCLWILQYTLV